MKPFFVVCAALACLASLSCNAQISATRLTKGQLPKGIRLQANLAGALRWTDKQGTHVVVATETGEMASVEATGGRSMGLAAQHWLVRGGGVLPTWLVTDGERQCPVDIAANFLPNTLAVTDLNRDGVGEVWLMYTTACHGDVSPQTVKVIMYQGAQKYAMRGQSRIRISATEYEGGSYQFDYPFRNAPPEFKAYAQALWTKNVKKSSN